MRQFDLCAKLKVLSICLLALIPLASISNPPAKAMTIAAGHPYHGRLINGVAFPSQFQGYLLRDPERSYTTPEVVGTLLDAIDAVRAQYPQTADIFLGDFSQQGGGWINHHRSHQNGRDVDIGMYAKGNRALDTFVLMTEENLDVPKTWCFVENLLRSQHIQYIFLDRRIQKLLYEYALSRGVDEGYLEGLFANARGSIVQHVPHHQDHIHVRFYTPWSTMAARVGSSDNHQLTLIEMAQQAYLPKKVNYYVKGTEPGIETLARSFGVSQKDLCRWNQMHLNDVLTPGSCIVYYKRGFETEPVHLARSLKPGSVAEIPAVRLASVNTTRITSDASPSSNNSYMKDKESANSVSSYVVKKGDSIKKIAARKGMDVKSFCKLNGLKETSKLKTGQKLKIGSSVSEQFPGVSPSHVSKAVLAKPNRKPQSSPKSGSLTSPKPCQQVLQVTKNASKGGVAVSSNNNKAAASKTTKDTKTSNAVKAAAPAPDKSQVKSNKTSKK